MTYVFKNHVVYGLDGELIFVGARVDSEFEPVTAHTPLGLALEHPHPLDVGVVLVAAAAHHSVVFHGVHDVRALLGSLTHLPHFHEERVLKQSLTHRGQSWFIQNLNALA